MKLSLVDGRVIVCHVARLTFVKICCFLSNEQKEKFKRNVAHQLESYRKEILGLKFEKSNQMEICSLLLSCAKVCSPEELLFIQKEFPILYSSFRDDLFESEFEEDCFLHWNVFRKNGVIWKREKEIEGGRTVCELFDHEGYLQERSHYIGEVLDGKSEMFDCRRFQLLNYSNGKLDGLCYSWYTQNEIERICGDRNCNCSVCLNYFTSDYTKAIHQEKFYKRMRKICGFLERYDYIRSITPYRKGKKHGTEFRVDLVPMIYSTSSTSYRHGKKHGTQRFYSDGMLSHYFRFRKGRITFYSTRKTSEEGQAYEEHHRFNWRTGRENT